MGWKIKYFFQLHKWLGRILGVIFVVISLSGTLLLFRKDVDRYVNKTIYHRESHKVKLSVDSVYRIVQEKYPDLKKIVLHDFPENRYEPYEFMLYRFQNDLFDNSLAYVFIDQYTGQVIRDGNYEESVGMFFRWLYSLHYNLLSGRLGEMIVVIVGVLMMISIISGVIVYKKHFWKTLTFQITFKKRKNKASLWHRVLGVWSIVLNSILIISGIWINWPSLTASHTSHHQRDYRTGSIGANLDSILKYTKASYPSFAVIAIDIPQLNNMPIVVKGHISTNKFPLYAGKSSFILFDTKTGAPIEFKNIEESSFDKRMSWINYQLHIGAWGGYLVRFFYLFIGMFPVVLGFTGLYIWYKKKEKR